MTDFLFIMVVVALLLIGAAYGLHCLKERRKREYVDPKNESLSDYKRPRPIFSGGGFNSKMTADDSKHHRHHRRHHRSEQSASVEEF